MWCDVTVVCFDKTMQCSSSPVHTAFTLWDLVVLWPLASAGCTLLAQLKMIKWSKSQAQVQSQIEVPNLGPKSRSQIQVPNPKSKVQRKGTGTGADNIILQATTHPPITFLTWNVNPVMGKDHRWPSFTFLDLTWPSMTFYDLLSPSKTSMTFND